MRPVKTKQRYRCDYCRYTSSSVPGMARHEGICWRNPDRYCPNCSNRGYHEWSEYQQEPCFFCSQRRGAELETTGRLT